MGTWDMEWLVTWGVIRGNMEYERCYPLIRNCQDEIHKLLTMMLYVIFFFLIGECTSILLSVLKNN